MKRYRQGLAALAVTAALAACGTTPVTAPAPSPADIPTATPSEATLTPSDSPTPSGTPSASPSSTGSATPRTGGTPTPSAVPTPSACARLAASMSATERAGQLLMVGISSGGASADVRAVLERTRAGSVLLLGNSTAGADVISDVTRQAAAAADPPRGTKTMLAADQEGGLVQRLRGSGFSVMPSAAEQADDSDARLRADAQRWGRQLAAAGIDANLAPVADVVPTALRRVNQPIGQLDRGYGSDPETVAAKATAFSEGMRAAGLAAAVKHFPGLGRVRGNTDFVSRVVDSTTTRDDADLAGFRAVVRSGVDMVMVSSATYSRIDDDRRAAFSPTVIDGMIRGDLGFDGVVISDDLSAAAMRDLSPARRAVLFIRAGGDLAIVGDPGQARAMSDGIRDAADDDPDFAAQVSAAVIRVLTMKQARGLATCG